MASAVVLIRVARCLVVGAEPDPEGDEDDDRRSSVEPTQSPQLLTSVQNLQRRIQLRKSKALAKVPTGLYHFHITTRSLTELLL